MSLLSNYLYERVPLPCILSDTEWRNWVIKASDEIMDVYSELQKGSLLSDALYAMVSAILFKIPSGDWPGDIYKITLNDVIIEAINQFSYGGLKLMRGLNTVSYYKKNFRKELLNKLFSRNIEIHDLCCCCELDFNQLKLWLDLGFRLPSNYERVLKAWIDLFAPWPLTIIELSYLNQIKNAK